MTKPPIFKKTLDKGEKMAYEKQDDPTFVLSAKETEEDGRKVGMNRKDVKDVLRIIEGLKQKLKRILDSA